MTGSWELHKDAREMREICRMLCERVVELEGECDQARAWAAAWKRAARRCREQRAWWEERARDELQRRASLEATHGIRQHKKEKQLRAALDGLLRCTAYREYGHCGQCEQRARIALEDTADE